MAGTGGKREGAGRKPGSVNKATSEVKELLEANVDFPAVIERLFELSQGVKIQKNTLSGPIVYNEKPDAYAARVLLEYRYGKPLQQIQAEINGEITEIRRTVISKGVGKS